MAFNFFRLHYRYSPVHFQHVVWTSNGLGDHGISSISLVSLGSRKIVAKVQRKC